MKELRENIYCVPQWDLGECHEIVVDSALQQKGISLHINYKGRWVEYKLCNVSTFVDSTWMNNSNTHMVQYGWIYIKLSP